MSGQAAYVKKVKVSTDGEAWVDLPATSPSLDIGGDVLDDTTLADNGGFRSRVLGLTDWSVQADSNWASGNSALAMVRDAKLNRGPLYVAYLPDGAAGYMGPVVVESYNQSGELGGLETVAISLQGNGPLEAYSA